MRTVGIKIFKFDELSNAAKEKARQWYREHGLDSDWHNWSIEDAKEILRFCGFEDTNILWEGFGSQGNGACFEGSWNANRVDVDGLKQYAPQDTDLHKFVEKFAEVAKSFPTLTAKLTHNRGRRYYHSHTIDFEFDYDEESFSGDSETFREIILSFNDNSRKVMNWIYNQLEKEYYYQTSDETIDGYFREHGYEFTEDGKVFFETIIIESVDTKDVTKE